MDFYSKYKNTVDECVNYTVTGEIIRVVGITVESKGPQAFIGEICKIKDRQGNFITDAEVVGFNGEITYIMPFSFMDGLRPGYIVEATGHSLKVKVGDFLLGKVLDGLGNLSDGVADENYQEYSINNTPPDPLKRKRIDEIMPTGVRCIDALNTFGKGQRMGIFAGSGVGKSVLMGMISKYSSADVIVIALIGERGREVREFIERDLGEEGMKKSVLVVATSDKPSLVRLKAPFVANSIAEYFRDQGKDVVLMMDSVTRLALAQREIGLAIGEPPTTRGYPPSVFTLLPQVLERAGTSEKGSITGLYTVLVEGGDMDEPVADAVRGILDGHILLSRDLAHKGHFPAIDILKSISRVMDDIIDEKHNFYARKMRSILAVYEEMKDMISLGAYTRGTNAELDNAIELIDTVNTFLKQNRNEYSEIDKTKELLGKICALSKV